MKFSDSANYLDYMHKRAHGDLDGAILSIKKCLSEFTSPEQRAFLLQVRGNLHFERGEVEASKKCYAESEHEAPTSVVCKYGHAKFLADNHSEYDEAIKKCTEIQSILLASSRQGDTESEVLKAQYSKMVAELISSCERALRRLR